MDQLVRLPEPDAEAAYFDALNCRALFRLLVFCVLVAIVVALVTAFQERFTALLVPAVNLVAVRALFGIREHPSFSRYFRGFLLVFMVAQGILWRLSIVSDPLITVHPSDFLAPALLLLFRLPLGLLVAPLATFWAMGAGRNLVMVLTTGAELHYPLVVLQSALTVVVAIFGASLTQRQRREFLVDWRREAHRQRERRRMQEELDDARKIQLSMLPQSEPKVPWLDIAGISIPASEVGGDYYDYFTLSPTRQAIVIGDVAGHGVASGLVLSGVRSCLHLLQEDNAEPDEILRRIDRVVRRTTRHRSFMTLLYAIFDQDEEAVTFAVAGHPPFLHRLGRTGEVIEQQIHALPLGTRLGTEPVRHQVDLAPGDVFLFFTDGIAETINAGGDLFGDERLSQRLTAVTPESSAKEIRDTVLGDVWAFKADTEQMDDITLIVAKVR